MLRSVVACVYRLLHVDITSDCKEIDTLTWNARLVLRHCYCVALEAVDTCRQLSDGLAHRTVTKCAVVGIVAVVASIRPHLDKPVDAHTVVAVACRLVTYVGCVGSTLECDVPTIHVVTEVGVLHQRSDVVWIVLGSSFGIFSHLHVAYVVAQYSQFSVHLIARGAAALEQSLCVGSTDCRVEGLHLNHIVGQADGSVEVVAHRVKLGCSRLRVVEYCLCAAHSNHAGVFVTDTIHDCFQRHGCIVGGTQRSIDMICFRAHEHPVYPVFMVYLSIVYLEQRTYRTCEGCTLGVVIPHVATIVYQLIVVGVDVGTIETVDTIAAVFNLPHVVCLLVVVDIHIGFVVDEKLHPAALASTRVGDEVCLAVPRRTFLHILLKNHLQGRSTQTCLSAVSIALSKERIGTNIVKVVDSGVNTSLRYL